LKRLAKSSPVLFRDFSEHFQGEAFSMAVKLDCIGGGFSNSDFRRVF